MNPLRRSALALLLAIVPASALEVDEEAQKKIGLQTAALEKIEIAPRAHAYATVLSPAPLIDLYRQIEAGEVATQLSKDTLERSEKLFASGELVARKDVEAARGQLVQDQAKGVALEDRLALEWGPAFAALSKDERSAQIKKLLERHAAIVRMALPKGESIEETPVAAHLTTVGHAKPLDSTVITPATSADPAFQAQTFIGLFESEGLLPPAGITLTGSLDLPGEKEEGMLVPASAVVIFQSRAWVYRKTGDEAFERTEVSMAKPVPGGWFIDKEALEEGEIVTTGAQSLLSKEALGDAPAGD